MTESEELRYLRARVAAVDCERADLLERLDGCAGPATSEVYRVQAENRKRTEEVRELQQALSAAHTYLFEERERLLALQAENDGLRLQECEDRARIKQILSLTRPADQRAAHGRGGNENGRPTTSALPRGAAPNRSKSPTAAALQQSQRVLRTLYLPAAHADAAALRCEALEAQLAEQKRFAAEHVAALKQDREIRERDAAGHAAALGAAAEELAERLRRAEEALRLTTRDFILAKQQRDAAEASAAAARDEAAAERRRAHQAADAAATAAEAALQQQRQELEAEGRAATEELAAQLAQREEELRKFETLHTLIRGQLEVRAQEAEQRAARATELARQSQQRRAHEMEGWAADVGQLRRRIGAIDRALRQQALLQRMPDGDARDAALARHARLANQSQEFELGLDKLVEELLSVKDSLLGMGERVRRQQGGAQPGPAQGVGGGGGGGSRAASSQDSEW